MEGKKCYFCHRKRQIVIFAWRNIEMARARYRMVRSVFFRLDGCSFYYAHIWCKSGISDLLKAFGYIKTVVKSDFFRKKTYFISYVRNMF